MKTFIIVIILIVICFFAFKSLYKTLKGEQGCGCSGSKRSKCPMKGKCSK